MMTDIELETRMKTLENELTRLKMRVEQTAAVAPTAWWQKIAGTFKDDAAHDEAMRLGREYRRTQNDALDDGEK